MNEILKTCSVAESKRLAALPSNTLRTEITAKIKALGAPLTRPECDGVLKLLAIACPRANLTPDDVHTMMDLYFGLLLKAGITGKMLRASAESYVMAPTKGKARWFPDPGQLAELCAYEAGNRRVSLAALTRALEIIDGKSNEQACAENSETDKSVVDIGQRLKDLANKLSTPRPTASHREEVQPVTPAHAQTARQTTDADELRATLARRTGGVA